MKLLIVIPTWNRASYLDKAVAAIVAAQEATDSCEVTLFISNNASTDESDAICRKWAAQCPWILYETFTEHVDIWEHILQRLFTTPAPQDYDYLWIHGDDDYITDVTAFNQIAAALDSAQEDPPAIIHCTQTRRAIPGDRRIIGGALEDLANQLGWLEILGWISSLVLAKETVARFLASKHWSGVATSAFMHSEILLEVAYGQTVLILGAGLIDNQDEKQTAETVQRWANCQVGARYWMCIVNLMKLKAKGALPTPLTLGFFRYHRYSLWDRFSRETLEAATDITIKDELIEGQLALLIRIGDLLGYGEDQKLYQDWVSYLSEEIWDVRRGLRKIAARVIRCNNPSFSNDLLPHL